MTRFTADELERANEAWSCNCGPGSVATIYDLTLDEVRPRFEGHGFAEKRYTNPTMMFGVLSMLGRPWQRVKTSKLSGAAAHMPWWGLCRIQWQGPWTMLGASPRWAYRHSHWIGAAKSKADGSIGVFDVNAMRSTGKGDGWISLADWSTFIVPAITAEIPRATGGWHITHAIEVAEAVP